MWRSNGDAEVLNFRHLTSSKEIMDSRKLTPLILLIVSSLITVTHGHIALIIVDVQKCFLPGGTLAVTDGNDIIPVIKDIRHKYNDVISLTVFTQDWHCPDHVSFASQHPGHNAFDVIRLLYNDQEQLCTTNSSCDVTHNISQTLWPDHCVINTDDANITTSLTMTKDDVLVRKGYHCNVDSYSGFYDNGGFSHTELHAVLQQNAITTVWVTGLALDFCVYYTSKDAQKLGYDVFTITDASRPVVQDNVDAVLEDLKTNGVHVISSTQLDDAISGASSIIDTTWRSILMASVIDVVGHLTT